MDKLIEEAIRICARNSLQSVYSTLHGNGVLNPNALFHVVLDIKETSVRITFFSSFLMNEKKKTFNFF